MLLSIQSDFIPSAAGQKKYWGQLHAGAQALAITELAQQSQHTLLVICDNSQQAYDLEQQVAFFNPALTRLRFPDWEILPYDRFSPHHDIVSERLRCLYQLSQQPKAVLFIPINTLMQKIAPPAYVASSSLQIKTGDQLNIQQLRQYLEQAHYQCVATVYEHGEFAVRGSIIDVFPMGTQQAPPCARTMPRTMVRPRPDPAVRRAA